MELKLYHYVHCPFCVRVRMALGFLNQPFESVVLPYDDEKTPVELTGTKMLPIAAVDGKAMNESLDIISLVDKANALQTKNVMNGPEFKSINELLNTLGSNVHNLAMPYWIYTPEFTESSRVYFQKKKEQKRGPFRDLVKRRSDFESQLNKDLLLVESELQPFYKSNKFTLNDILIASHIWGLYVVPEFQFSEKMHQYLQRVKHLCKFDYHHDYWS